MSEPKYRYRIPPCPEYDLPGMESWLEDMAAKGLHIAPDGFFAGFATFEEGPPRQERFRLEATPTNGGILSEQYGPEQRAVDLNADLGWTYRARRGQFHIYSTSDPQAPELNTDPQVQAMTMKALGKYLRGRLWNTCFWCLLYIGLRCYDMLLSLAVAMGAIPALMLFSLFAGMVVHDGIIVYRVSRLRKQLQTGIPLPHRRDYRKNRNFYWAGKILRIVLYLVALWSIVSFSAESILEERAIPLEDYDRPLPFATAEDFYPEAEMELREFYFENQVFVWDTLLTPENYDYAAYSQVVTAGDAFDISLDVQYHNARWEWVARRLARELVSQDGGNAIDQFFDGRFGRHPVYPEVLELEGVDYAVYYRKFGTHRTFVIQRGTTVIDVTYAELTPDHPKTPEEIATIILEHLD